MRRDVELATVLLRAASRCPSLRPATYMEIAGFCNGVKPALRFVIDRVDADTIAQASIERGLSAATAEVFIEPRTSSWSNIVSSPTISEATLIAISHDGKADLLVAAELADSHEAGIRLGYPSCCVNSLDKLASAPANWPHVLLSGRRSGAGRVNARLNRFAAEWGGIGLIGELFPCSLDCRAASAYADTLLDSAVSIGLTQLATTASAHAQNAVSIDHLGNIYRGRVAPHTTIEFEM